MGVLNPALCHATDLGQWLEERNLLTEVIWHNLARAQLRMKQHADKNRSERQFQLGDMVYLKVQPYIQTSVVQRTNQKLSFRFYGPYKVLQHIREVAYKLDLPPEARIHPVVHVSQLKSHIAPEAQVSDDVTELSEDSDMIITPLQFQDTRMVKVGGSAVTQIKVSWTGVPSTFEYLGGDQ